MPRSNIFGNFRRKFSAGNGTPSPVTVSEVLARVDQQIQRRQPFHDVLNSLNEAKPLLYQRLSDHFGWGAVAQALTLKTLNLILGKYSFRSVSTTVPSRPYGLIVDAMNNCTLACPGCVHSTFVKVNQLFDWKSGMLSVDRLAAFLQRYGPYALEIALFNYGEPLLNPQTPQLIRLAKTYLLRTTISTNLTLKQFDAEAYVQSGLDYMIVSLDGATQPTYQKFRKKGNLEVALANLRKLVHAKRRLQRLTPFINWRFLAFEHNIHEIEMAREIARETGVDQFQVALPWDVSWDDPTIKPADVNPITYSFETDAHYAMALNWNPFPDDLQAEAIDREFNHEWARRLEGAIAANRTPSAASGQTCAYLYKNAVMDATGRILPCCGAPGPRGGELVFSQLDGPAEDHFNTEIYRLARLSFANPKAYQEARGTNREPHCADCKWTHNWHEAQIGSGNAMHYMAGMLGAILSKSEITALCEWNPGPVTP